MLKILSNIVSDDGKPDGIENSILLTIKSIIIFVVIFAIFIFLIRKFYNPKNNNSTEKQDKEEGE